MRATRRQHGFTLMELMIVVTIVGILFAIAVPSYRAYAIRTNRAAAESDLMRLAHVMERSYTAGGRYDDADNPGTFDLPFTTSPEGHSDAAYDLSFKQLDSNAFTLQAIPSGPQAEDTKCGAVTLDEAGVKCILDQFQCSNADDNAKAAVADCW